MEEERGGYDAGSEQPIHLATGTCPTPHALGGPHSGPVELRIHQGYAQPKPVPFSLLDHAPNSLPKWLGLLLVPREPLAQVSLLQGEPRLWGGQRAADAGMGGGARGWAAGVDLRARPARPMLPCPGRSSEEP